jgi:cytochrome c oxidase subunit 2
MWNFPLFPESASSVAPEVDMTYLLELAITTVVGVLTVIVLTIFVIRFRVGTNVDRSNPPVTSKFLEITWIAIPLVLFLGMFAVSTQTFYNMYQPPPDATEIFVVGKQWMWYLQHPEGKREINELHLPVGRAVKLRMTSQDVIHSFYVPAFRVKQDVLPGRYTEMWFKPTKVGTYHLFCTEYCGTNHSTMGGWVHVMAEADYEAWLAKSKEATETMAQQGKKLFVQYHCAGCHGPDSSVQAPRLEGVYGHAVPIEDGDTTRLITADDRYIRDSILLPKNQVVAGYKPIMPSFDGQISEDDLLKIIQYIKSLNREVAR